MSVRRWSQTKLKERWATIMADYRRRQREWVMRSMPSMPEDQWNDYMRWVAAFGGPTQDRPGRNSRKVRRQLKAAKNTRQKDLATQNVASSINAPIVQKWWRANAANPKGKVTAAATRRQWTDKGRKLHAWHALVAGAAKQGGASPRK